MKTLQNLKKLTIFDTSIATSNVGDFIIMDAVNRELHEIFSGDYFTHVPTHDIIGPVARRHARAADISFVGGTNLLCPHWFITNQWKIGKSDFWRVGHPILLGVGWQKYCRSTDIFTAWMLQYLLNNKYKHSVRDAYTQTRLAGAGVTNAINTGCVTMWRLTPEHCKIIPTQKSDSVVMTVTCYDKNPKVDQAWINLVCAKYKNVYFWPQMVEDEPYFLSICNKEVKWIGGNISAYDKFLISTDVDFVGTRLHGGIRALQHKRRALILEVDNRAKEMGKDTDLPTCDRGDLEKIGQMIDASAETKLRLAMDNILSWKAQFKS